MSNLVGKACSEFGSDDLSAPRLGRADVPDIASRTLLLARLVHRALLLEVAPTGETKHPLVYLRQTYAEWSRNTGQTLPNVPSLRRFTEFALFVADEYKSTFTTPSELRLALEALGAVFGVGHAVNAVVSKHEQAVFEDLEAAIRRNGLDHDLPDDSRDLLGRE